MIRVCVLFVLLGALHLYLRTRQHLAVHSRWLPLTAFGGCRWRPNYFLTDIRRLEFAGNCGRRGAYLLSQDLQLGWGEEIALLVSNFVLFSVQHTNRNFIVIQLVLRIPVFLR
jgi:hypothetical protein